MITTIITILIVLLGITTGIAMSTSPRTDERKAHQVHTMREVMQMLDEEDDL